jgi:hypothetical protein
MQLPEYNGSPADKASGDLSRPAPDFDVRVYARTAVGNLREGLDLDAYLKKPLSEPTLRSIRLLQAVERSTMQHLRTVLVTPTHKDARITAFLTTWAFEKFWIADALSAILSAHEALSASRPASALKRGYREVRERFAPIRESLVANQIGVPMLAVHMSEGAIDGWVTQAAYARISELEPNPELEKTIETILSIKARHLTFFEPQSEYRLGASVGAQKLARKRLKKSAWPIGADELPTSDRQYFFDRLFRSSAGLAESIDTAIDGLPGLTGLGLISRAAGTRSAA